MLRMSGCNSRGIGKAYIIQRFLKDCMDKWDIHLAPLAPRCRVYAFSMGTQRGERQRMRSVIRQGEATGQRQTRILCIGSAPRAERTKLRLSYQKYFRLLQYVLLCSIAIAGRTSACLAGAFRCGRAAAVSAHTAQEPLANMGVPRVVFWRQKLGRGGDDVTRCEFAELLERPSV
jgi:hypothetical protein